MAKKLAKNLIYRRLIEKAKKDHDSNYASDDWTKDETHIILKKTNEVPYSRDKSTLKVRRLRKRKYNHFVNKIDNHLLEGRNWIADNFYIKQDLLLREKIKTLCAGTVSIPTVMDKSCFTSLLVKSTLVHDCTYNPS